MAKKKGDDIENNDDLNDQTNSDFNEADDSFGLPDVDFEPLDEAGKDEMSEEDVTSYDIKESVTAEDTTVEEENAYAAASDSGADDGTNEQAENNTEETEYVPGSYQKPEEDSSNVGKVIGVVLIVVLAALAIWYFGFHRPAQIKEQQRIEQIAKQKEADRIAAEKKAEEERQAEEAARIAAEEAAAEEASAEPEVGTVETINARTGRYYIVVASALDGDLAMDYANELAKEGANIEIIPPFGTSKFHRVTVDNVDSWAAGENRANELKSEYGEDVWVIKY